MTQVRSAIGAVVIILVLFFLKRPVAVGNSREWLGVYLLGIIMGVHWVTFFHAMQISTIAIGMISLYTFPIMIVLTESLIHRHWPKWQDILSAFLVLGGIFLMAGNEAVAPNSATWEGIFWGTISALLFTARNLIQKYHFAGISSDRLMLHQMIAIAIMLFVFIDFSAVEDLSGLSWVKVLALSIVTTALAHTLLVKSYKNLPAKTVAMISCLQPVIGALLAWLILNEESSIYVISGGAIVLAVAVYESWASTNT